MYICLTKVILLPSEKKRLFSLVADSPETIGFSGRVLQNITPFENINIDITYNIQLTILVSNCGFIVHSPYITVKKLKYNENLKKIRKKTASI
jgi:hypothetical protein